MNCESFVSAEDHYVKYILTIFVPKSINTKRQYLAQKILTWAYFYLLLIFFGYVLFQNKIIVFIEWVWCGVVLVHLQSTESFTMVSSVAKWKFKMPYFQKSTVLTKASSDPVQLLSWIELNLYSSLFTTIGANRRNSH